MVILTISLIQWNPSKADTIGTKDFVRSEDKASCVYVLAVSCGEDEH